MNDEVQLDAQITDAPITMDTPTDVVVETEVKPEVVADSSPASEDNHDKQHDGVQKRFNKLTAQRYEEQRRADAAEAELARIRAEKQQPAAELPTSEPTLPEDAYDTEAMQKYHSDMVAYSQQQAVSAVDNRLTERHQQEQDRTQKAAHEKIVNTYVESALRDGVDGDKLQAAGQALNQAGMSNELGAHIMQDANGGKIAEYLYDNPALMHEVLNLDPVSAGIKIANEIKPQVLSTTPKVSSAPAPIPDIQGGGVVEKDDFERDYPGTTFN